MADDLRFEIEAEDGSTDAFTVPGTLIDRLADDGEETATVAADVAVMAFAGRAHALVHHGHGEVDADLEAAESAMLDAFEDRFGVSYADATGHAH